MVLTTNANPVRGSKVLYFTQPVSAEIGSQAILPAHQTDGGMTLGGDNLDEQTKQGRVIEKSTDEHSIDLTQYYVPADPSLKDIEDAKINGTSIKVWRVVVDKSVAEGDGDENTYPAKFGYGMPDDISYSDGQDGFVEVSYTLNIIGALKGGRFPLSDEDLAVIESLYDYQNPGETTGDYDNIQDAPDV